MNILQTIDLKKYYGTEPNITRALNGCLLYTSPYCQKLIIRVPARSFPDIQLLLVFRLRIYSHNLQVL